MEHTAINWIQIPSKDLDRAQKFYEEVFNFSFFQEVLNDIPHALFEKDKDGSTPVNGAIIQVKPDVEIGVGPVLFFDATGSFDHILEQTPKMGGEVIKRKTLIKKNLEKHMVRVLTQTYIDGKVGYYAHIKDSEGNRIGLYGSY